MFAKNNDSRSHPLNYARSDISVAVIASENKRRYLFHFLVGWEHSVSLCSAIPRATVIVSLIPRLDPRDM